MTLRIRPSVELGGNLTVAGDLNVTGRIDRVEDIAFAATEMFSAAAMATGSSYPRLTFPDAASTSAFVGAFNFPDWYDAGTDIHISFVNDAAGAGNARISWTMRQVNVGGSVAGGTVVSTGTSTIAMPNPGDASVAVLDASVLPAGGAFFGYAYGIEITRLGADGADTLAGNFGLAAVGFSRLF